MDTKEINNIISRIELLSDEFYDKKGPLNKRIHSAFKNSYSELLDIQYRFIWTEEEENILSDIYHLKIETSQYIINSDVELIKEDGFYSFITWAGMGWKTIKKCSTFEEVEKLIKTKAFG